MCQFELLCAAHSSAGEVWRGTCRGQEVAIKKLHKQALDAKTLNDFRKEVEIMSNNHHPNVVLFMGACTQPTKMVRYPAAGVGQTLTRSNAGDGFRVDDARLCRRFGACCKRQRCRLTATANQDFASSCCRLCCAPQSQFGCTRMLLMD
jgi:hypothetical protein